MQMTHIPYGSKKLKTIETIANTELKLISNWLRLNKLSLNAKNGVNFVSLYSPSN